MRPSRRVAFALLLAGCATSAPVAPPPDDPNRFTGEVLVWDDAERIVTLQTDDGQVRVRVSAAEPISPRLREAVTVRGEIAPWGEPSVLPGQAYRFTPTGPEDQTRVTARVVAIDIEGRIIVESERGPTEVWVTDATRYGFGDPVEIGMTVRPGWLERIPGAPARAPAPRWTEPGDHAVVAGRILSVNPGGTITVDSPRGPVIVWVTRTLARYRAGESAEVRTRVRPAP